MIEDTICAPATGTSGAAIAVIRISGPRTFEILSKVVEFRSPVLEGGRVKYGVVPGLDEVLVGIFKAPRSYTGEDSAEISCHCSPFIVSRLLEMLVDNGARTAAPGEFTRRAFVNGKMDLAQAEAVADLIASESRIQHKLALDQLRGKYSEGLSSLRNELVELSSLLELELDFSEEDVEFASRERLRRLLDDALAEVNRLVDSFRLGNALRQGVSVAIVGEPNSGKSTLLNALLGEDRAIVSDIPGTTRDTVEETLNIGGIKFRFIDTAGLRESGDAIEKIGIERSYAAIERAAIVVLVVDGAELAGLGLDGGVVGALAGSDGGVVGALAGSDGGVVGALAGAVVTGEGGVPCKCRYEEEIRSRLSGDQTLITVVNKVDLSPAPEGMLGISALNGDGLDELRDRICKSVNFDTDHLMVSNERHCHALRRAASALCAVRRGLDSGTQTELICLDLRTAIDALNEIFGRQIGTEEVLGEIFGRFCIGK
ncbi:MAG: tRNA uridine-5-carboxymethylaminomethyl(34) synthesis GTPase MnmE [Bacteroidales bacterium]|nr:tRNA uridine-5-carboxymethylaminomethyl(34) synthesis GTPase MnmE [Bacteroidales bacterium]